MRIGVHIRDIFMKYSLDFHHAIGVQKYVNLDAEFIFAIKKMLRSDVPAISGQYFSHVLLVN